jgi:hypothetical protein
VQTEVVGNTSEKEIQADIQYKCDNCEIKPANKENFKGPIEPLQDTIGTDKKDDNSNHASEVKVKIEFQKYPCYYCGINIAGEYHLDTSVVDGPPVLPSTTKFTLIFRSVSNFLQTKCQPTTVCPGNLLVRKKEALN